MGWSKPMSRTGRASAHLDALEGNDRISLPPPLVPLCRCPPQRQTDLRARVIHQRKVTLIRLLPSPAAEENKNQPPSSPRQLRKALDRFPTQLTYKRCY